MEVQGSDQGKPTPKCTLLLNELDKFEPGLIRLSLMFLYKIT